LAHAYLDYWKIEKADEDENELPTDLSRAYLGLGRLLLRGYEPVRWRTGNDDGCTDHTLTLGYVDAEGIRYGISFSARLRRDRSLVAKLGWIDRLSIWWASLHWREVYRETR